MSIKEGPQFDIIRFMDDFKKSVDFYNSYGLQPKSDKKAPLGEKNQ